MHRPPRALIFVPRSADSARWWKVCVELCQARGYDPVAVVHRYEDVQRVVELDHIEVVVAALWNHFPQDRHIPREEAAEDGAPRPATQRRARRTSRRREDPQ